MLLALGHQLASQAVPVHLTVGVQHVLHVLGDFDLLLKLLLRSPALASFPPLEQGKPRLELGQFRRLAPDVVVVFLHQPVVDGLSLGFRQKRQGAGHAIAHGFQRFRRLVHPVVAGVRHRCVMPGYVLGSGLCAASVVGVRQDLAQLFLRRANPVLVPLLHRLFQLQLRHPVLSLPLGVHGVQRGSVLPGDIRCDLLVACRAAGVAVPCPDGFRHLVGGFPCFKVPQGVGHVPPHLFLLDALPVRAGQLLVVLGQLVFRCLGRLVRPVVLVLLLPLGKLLWRQLASEVLCVKLRQVHARAALQVCVGLGPVQGGFHGKPLAWRELILPGEQLVAQQAPEVQGLLCVGQKPVLLAHAGEQPGQVVLGVRGIPAEPVFAAFPVGHVQHVPPVPGDVRGFFSSAGGLRLCAGLGLEVRGCPAALAPDRA